MKRKEKCEKVKAYYHKNKEAINKKAREDRAEVAAEKMRQKKEAIAKLAADKATAKIVKKQAREKVKRAEKKLRKAQEIVKILESQ